jgi:predicted transcriptional regulator
MKRTNIYLSEPDAKVLADLAKQRDVSVSELIRQAIAQYLKREKSERAN